MATIRPPRDERTIKKLGLKDLRAEYDKVAENLNKLLNGDVYYCHRCNDFLSPSQFYTDYKYASGSFPICKKCLLEMVEQRTKRTDKPNETKESVRAVLRMMDLPYIDELYESCCKSVSDGIDEKQRRSPFLQMITCLKSLPQYRGKTWKDGDIEVENVEEVDSKKIKASTIKRFGKGLDNDDYYFLQTQYDDWVSRYECNTKAQEELFERLCFKKLEIFKATREGKPTKDLDESYQKLMSTANIAPKQNSLDVLSEGQTLGQMIERWETERPLPDIDPDLQDVDKIGAYIDVFFKGHMAKMLNLKNPLSNVYEKYMKKYTVNKPEYDEEEDSEQLFDKIFGSRSDD